MTVKTYEKYPQFINTDPRLDRSGWYRGYSVNSQFMEDRHYSFFYEYDLTNKTVLDIGCCVGATGAYVLDHGAKFYHGIDVDQKLISIARKNLSVFDQNLWSISENSLEKFSLENTTHYDIVVMSGVLYAVFDCIPLLTNLSKFTNCILIEGMHPDFSKNIPDKVSVMLRQFNLWDNFLENASYIEHGPQRMLVGELVPYYGSKQSLGFLNTFLPLLGFKNSQKVYQQLKNKIPYLYNYHNRYAERFEKTHLPIQELGYVGV